MIVEAIKRAKQQWQAAVDSMPQLICLLDRDGRVIRVNRTLERWGLGSVETVNGQRLHHVLHPVCNDPGCYLEQFLSGADADPAGNLRAQREVLDPVLSRHLSIFLQPLLRSSEFDSAPCALVSFDDITAFKLLTQDLGARLERESTQRVQSEEVRARLLAIIEKTPDLVAMADADGSMVHLNPAGRVLLGLGTAADVSGLRLGRCLGRGLDERLDAADVHDKTEFALREGVWSGETALVDGSGRIRPASSVLIAHRGAGGQFEGLSTIVRDISERAGIEGQLRQSREDLRKLSASHVNMQEDERKRIAAGLHDGIGQALSLIKLAIEDAASRFSAGDTAEVAGALKRLVPNVADAMQEVRRIAMALRPPIIDDLGILAALSVHCRELSAVNTGVIVRKSFDVHEDQIAAELKLPIYRIVQEAAHNVVKHAKAKTLHIGLACIDGDLQLRVEDDGCGFHPRDARLHNGDPRGLGLLSMEERALLSAGHYELASAPGRGTRIRVTWKCGADAGPARSAA